MAIYRRWSEYSASVLLAQKSKATEPGLSAKTGADGWVRRWARRLITIPSVAIGLLLVTALLPVLVPCAAALDLVRGARRSRFVSVRLLLTLEAFLFAEAAGLGLLLACFLSTGGSPARRERLTFRVQRIYTGMCFAAVRRLFALRFVVEGAELAAEGGPLLVFVRHVSVIDVLLPAAFVANVHALELRYVVKRELLVDPCIDVAGHWLPNCFVSRDGGASAKEVAWVRSLAHDLPARGGVLLYPEGTRFSPKKRARVLSRLRDEPEAAARAERLRNVLPIRPGGALALLEAAPLADVLFVAHHGLEGCVAVRDIWEGTLVGRTVHVKMWRERAESLPGATAEPAERLAWLSARWQRLDDWLEEQH